MFHVTDYVENAKCCNCDKDTECVMVQADSFTAPHCSKCVLREAKKRKSGMKDRTIIPIHQEVQ